MRSINNLASRAAIAWLVVFHVTRVWLSATLVEGFCRFAFHGRIDSTTSYNKSFRPKSTFGGTPLDHVPSRPRATTKDTRPGSRRCQLSMRDASASYWFQVGDLVRVASDQVVKAGVNLHGRVGTVRETWEKCDVDPTCCCAEQVDRHMAVRVEFAGSEEDTDAAGCSFLHYFAEDELVKLPVDADKDPVEAFDGMSCKAFKLEQLQVDSRRRGLSSFEPKKCDTDQ